MRVMMISLDSSLLGDPHGNTVQRHIAYADRIGTLAIVVYNPPKPHRSPQTFSGSLTVYPTNTRPITYPLAAYRAAARLQRAEPFDLVTTQDPFATGITGLLLKWRFGLPLDVQNHSSFFNNPDWMAERPLRNRALHLLGRLVVRRADTHRVLTEGEKCHYLAMGIPTERIAVQHTPTDVRKFAMPVPPERTAALRDALNIPPGAPVLLWVGMPAEVKNIPLLLAAFTQVQHEMPETRLILAGDFSGRPDLAPALQAPHIITPGRVDHDDLPAYYALADCYVHSSRYEGFGKVLAEALAAGTPVVATSGDGPRAIVKDGQTGLLTEHTAEALAAAILALLRDPARRVAMGAAGRADVLERFDYDRQLDAIVTTFQRTLDVTGKGR